MSKKDIMLRLAIIVIFGICAATILICGGCAHIKVPTPQGDAGVTTFFKNVEVPKFSMKNENGNSITMEGYKSTVDSTFIESFGSAFGNAVKAAGLVP